MIIIKTMLFISFVMAGVSLYKGKPRESIAWSVLTALGMFGALLVERVLL